MMRTMAAFLVLLSACTSQGANIGGGWHTVVDTPPEPIEAIDILFVIDNSGSMQNDQYALVSAAGQQLFAQLEVELGGMPDLHLGVVSTDLGAGPYPISGCTGTGDNGIFQSARGDAAPVDCTGPTDSYIVDIDDGAGGRIRNYDPVQGLAGTFSCIGRLGITGCGFEQPLEAMRRALDGTNPENAGFLRDDAFLLVVLLTDEDDCSAFDTAMFDTASTMPDDPLGALSSFRCFEYGVRCDPDNPRTLGAKQDCVTRDDSPYMTPVDDFAAFLATQKTDPSLVMLAGIVPPPGPVAVVGAQETGNPVLGEACTPPPIPCPPEEPDCSQGPVQPAVRLDAIIHSFPARYAFEPMCDDTTANMLSRIARTAAGVMAGDSCLLGDRLPLDAACRAFDVVGNERTAIPPCGDGDGTCFLLVEDLGRCGYTPSRIRVHVQRNVPPPAGARLLVECLGN